MAEFFYLLKCNASPLKLKKFLDCIHQKNDKDIRILAYVGKSDIPSLKCLAEYEKLGLSINCVLAKTDTINNTTEYRNILLQQVKPNCRIKFIEDFEEIDLLHPKPIGKSEYLSATYVPFSILIRAHNRPRLLKEALTSILEQNYPNIRVLVSMDDYDDLGSLNVIREFQKKGLEINIHRVKPLGYPACNLYINELATHVEPDNWVHVLDDKNKYIDMTLFHTVSEIIKKEDPDAVMIKFSSIHKPDAPIPSQKMWKMPLKCGHVGSPNMFIKYDKLKYMIWTSRHPGDFDGLNGVYEHCDKEKIYWLDRVAVLNVPMKGKSE